MANSVLIPDVFRALSIIEMNSSGRQISTGTESKVLRFLFMYQDLRIHSLRQVSPKLNRCQGDISEDEALLRFAVFHEIGYRLSRLFFDKSVRSISIPSFDFR